MSERNHERPRRPTRPAPTNPSCKPREGPGRQAEEGCSDPGVRSVFSAASNSRKNERSGLASACSASELRCRSLLTPVPTDAKPTDTMAKICDHGFPRALKYVTAMDWSDALRQLRADPWHLFDAAATVLGDATHSCQSRPLSSSVRSKTLPRRRSCRSNTSDHRARASYSVFYQQSSVTQSSREGCDACMDLPGIARSL